MSRFRETWLEQKEFLRRSGYSLRTLQRMVRERQVKVRLMGKRSRNGRSVMQYALSALPPTAQFMFMQERIARSHIPESQMSIIPHPDTHADRQIDLFISPPAISEDVRMMLTSEQNEIAQRRLEIISPMLKFLQKSNGHKPTVRLHDGPELTNLRGVAEYIAQQQKISLRTVWDWYSRFKKHGFPGLADNIRSDKGASRFFREYPLVAEFAQAKYLGEKLSVRRVHEAIVAAWNDKENLPPHYDTVRAYLNALPRPISIMAREGETEFHNRCAPFLITDFKTVRPNQIWVSDHVKHDVWVRNDMFPGFPMNAKLRPWMTAIVDMRTRKCVGAVWCANPSSHSISSALRISILQWGIPETFYIDNGKDFEAIGRIGFSPEASGVLARLRIEPQYCIPKHPQSKLIERWFGTMHERFDKLWHPFYCGASPSARPEECDLALKEHDKLFKENRPHSSPLPLASEFVALCQDWIEEYNASHPHTGKEMNGRAPDEVFEDHLLPEAKRRKLEDPRALDVLFWQRDKRRVSEGGCVQLFNQRYEPADAESASRLFMEIERDIFVACDPNNLGDAIALDIDGRFIGTLRCQKLVARGPVSREDVRAGMRKQRFARRAVKDYVNFISGSFSSELENMRSKSSRMSTVRGLPAPPEIIAPLKKAAGAEPIFVGDLVKKFLEDD